MHVRKMEVKKKKFSSSKSDAFFNATILVLVIMQQLLFMISSGFNDRTRALSCVDICVITTWFFTVAKVVCGRSVGHVPLLFSYRGRGGLSDKPSALYIWCAIHFILLYFEASKDEQQNQWHTVHAILSPFLMTRWATMRKDAWESRVQRVELLFVWA